MTISKLKHGYQVRVTRRGVCHSRYFKLKRDAQQYEKELLHTLGPVESQKGKPKNTKLPNTGVKRIVKRILQRKDRDPVNVYTIYWRTADGQPRDSSVSIDYWGPKKAFQLAKQKKKEKDAEQLATDNRRRRKRRLK